MFLVEHAQAATQQTAGAGESTDSMGGPDRSSQTKTARSKRNKKKKNTSESEQGDDVVASENGGQCFIYFIYKIFIQFLFSCFFSS